MPATGSLENILLFWVVRVLPSKLVLQHLCLIELLLPLIFYLACSWRIMGGNAGAEYSECATCTL